MVETEPYRITHQVPLLRIEAFCHSLQSALAPHRDSGEVARIWSLCISAECPKCGIRVSGNELYALAFAPCAELASAKIGRMRLGNCARLGCEAWHYEVRFWKADDVDWSRVIQAAELADRTETVKPNGQRRLRGMGWPSGGLAFRAAAALSILLVLWLAREIYLGGRIPYLREPEKFIIDTTPRDSNWPAPIDGA